MNVLRPRGSKNCGGFHLGCFLVWFLIVRRAKKGDTSKLTEPSSTLRQHRGQNPCHDGGAQPGGSGGAGGGVAR